MSFSDDLIRFAAKSHAEADKRVRGVCLALTRDVILRTPVDTGRLRGNWQTSLDAPQTGTTDRKDKSGGASIAAAQDDIAQATGRVFYLANNLPYAAVVEFGEYPGQGPKTTAAGFSTQAPQGMVRVAVERARKRLK